MRWIAEGGGSNHAWRIRDLENSELDSLYGGKKELLQDSVVALLGEILLGKDTLVIGRWIHFSGVLVRKASDMTFPKRRHQAYSLWWDRTRQ